VSKTGFATAQLFFSTWLFPLGYLVHKSGFLPRFLGAVLVLDGVGVLIWFLQAILLPDHPALSYPAFALGFIAQLSRRLKVLAEELRYDRRRLRDWRIAHALLSACWSIEDHGDGWQHAVATAEALATL
jgi:hypothetical protein